MYRLFPALIALWLTLFAGSLQAATDPFGPKSGPVAKTEHVRAELVAHAPQGITSGGQFWVGLNLEHAPHWHTYWKNSGDSGLPTTLEFKLPAGLKAGDIAWPLPHKIAIGTLANYGYENTILLPVPIAVGKDFSAREAIISVKANWLVCRRECIPEEVELSLRIPAQGSTASNGALFDAAFQAVPAAAKGAVTSSQVSGSTLNLSVKGLPTAWQGKNLLAFPESPEVIETAAPITQQWRGDAWSATIPLAKHRGAIPAQMPWVLAPESRQSPLRVVAQVAGATAAPAGAVANGSSPPSASSSSAGLSPALQAALEENKARASGQPTATPLPTASSEGAPLGLALAILGAFVGGMILNLMPCVFPVLAIKVLHLTEHASDPRTRVQTGLAYATGVLVSFVLLGALLMALRAAGESLGWGFQLQNPWVVGALALLFTLIGLNLLGWFEVGQVVPSSVLNWEARHPMVDAFASGVLAVAVASPCTAPFMGASLGLTLSLPTAQSLLIFAAIGVGMAAPYLLLVSVPHLVERLPRPGAWMITFKKIMAVPMFLTVVWLGWVLWQQIGPAPAPVAAQAEGRWKAWSPERVEQTLASGKPVFVDFTAAWCVTCQVNKKTVLNDEKLLADMEAKGVVFMVADWTRKDERITAALKQLGRSGVPVYLLLAPGRPPVVMSELLSEGEVRGHLSALP